LGIQYIEEYAKANAFNVLAAIICGENEKSTKLFEKLPSMAAVDVYIMACTVGVERSIAEGEQNGEYVGCI